MRSRRSRQYAVSIAPARPCRRSMASAQQGRSLFWRDFSLLKAHGKQRPSENIFRPSSPPTRTKAGSISAASLPMEPSVARGQTAFPRPHMTKRLRAFSSNSSPDYKEWAPPRPSTWLPMLPGLSARTDRCTQRHADDEDSGRTWVSWPADIQWDRRVKADSEHERAARMGRFNPAPAESEDRNSSPFETRNLKLETERPIQPCEKRVRAAPFRIPQLSRSYFWLFWKRLLTSAQFTTFHHSFR